MLEPVIIHSGLVSPDILRVGPNGYIDPKVIPSSRLYVTSLSLEGDPFRLQQDVQVISDGTVNIYRSGGTIYATTGTSTPVTSITTINGSTIERPITGNVTLGYSSGVFLKSYLDSVEIRNTGVLSINSSNGPSIKIKAAGGLNVQTVRDLKSIVVTQSELIPKSQFNSRSVAAASSLLSANGYGFLGVQDYIHLHVNSDRETVVKGLTGASFQESLKTWRITVPGGSGNGIRLGRSFLGEGLSGGSSDHVSYARSLSGVFSFSSDLSQSSPPPLSSSSVAQITGVKAFTPSYTGDITLTYASGTGLWEGRLTHNFNLYPLSLTVGVLGVNGTESIQGNGIDLNTILDINEYNNLSIQYNTLVQKINAYTVNNTNPQPTPQDYQNKSRIEGIFASKRLGFGFAVDFDRNSVSICAKQPDHSPRSFRVRTVFSFEGAVQYRPLTVTDYPMVLSAELFGVPVGGGYPSTFRVMVTNVKGASGYLWTTPSGQVQTTHAEIDSTQHPEFSFTSPGVYHYTVQGFNDSGAGPATPFSVTIRPRMPQLSADKATLIYSPITNNWSVALDVSYQSGVVYINDYATGAVVGQTSGTTNTTLQTQLSRVVINGLTSGKSYRFTSQASYGGVSSDPSPPISLTIPVSPVTVPPGSPKVSLVNEPQGGGFPSYVSVMAPPVPNASQYVWSKLTGVPRVIVTDSPYIDSISYKGFGFIYPGVYLYSVAGSNLGGSGPSTQFSISIRPAAPTIEGTPSSPVYDSIGKKWGATLRVLYQTGDIQISDINTGSTLGTFKATQKPYDRYKTVDITLPLDPKTSYSLVATCLVGGISSGPSAPVVYSTPQGYVSDPPTNPTVSLVNEPPTGGFPSNISVSTSPVRFAEQYIWTKNVTGETWTTSSPYIDYNVAPTFTVQSPGTYSYTVAASNVNGTGPASSFTITVRPSVPSVTGPPQSPTYSADTQSWSVLLPVSYQTGQLNVLDSITGSLVGSYYPSQQPIGTQKQAVIPLRGLTPNRTYNFVIQASAGSAQSSVSSYGINYTAPDDHVTSSPAWIKVYLEAEPLGGGFPTNVLVSFPKVPFATSYVWDRAGTGLEFITSDPYIDYNTMTSFIFTSPGVYTHTVRGRNLRGDGPSTSFTVEITPAQPGSPSNPRNLIYDPKSGTWSADFDVVYQTGTITISEYLTNIPHGSASPTQQSISEFYSTTITASNLVPGKTYRLQAIASTPQVSSHPSDPLTFTAPSPL